MKFSLFLNFIFFKEELKAFVHSIYPDILVTTTTTETLELLNM
jgi:hypothetical protein